MSEQPYFSIVATTRNDNHGGDLLKRTSCFVKGVYHQAKKFDFPIELIIVEWNPPSDRPLLKDVLPKPKKGNPATLRFIVVPNEIHQQFKNGDILPLHQMIAKNVGIRRAEGQFVLCTNIDILFSDRCFKKLAQRNLKKNHFYRTRRCDVPSNVMNINNIDSQLAYCKKNILNKSHIMPDYKYLGSIPDIFFGFPNLLYLIDCFLGIFLFFIKKKRRNINFLNSDACGDFTIMAKEDWFRINGYYELEMFPLHIDSMALIEAYAIGLHQKTFNRFSCVYHIYHDNGWGSDYKEPEDLVNLMERRPALDWYGIKHGGKKLIKQKRNYRFPHENWGLRNCNLTEYSFNSEHAS